MTEVSDDRVAITIIHGDVESDAEAKSLQAIRNAVEPWWIKTEGTNDTTTFHLRRAGVETLMRTVRAHHRSWWKVSMRSEVPLR